jgi:hypothetical protein
VHEDTSTQRSHHRVWRSARSQKHKKGPYPRPNQYQLNSPEEKKNPYIEAKRDKEKIKIAADGETKKVYLDDMPDRAVTIGAHLTLEEENELIRFLNKNKDVFA